VGQTPSVKTMRARSVRSTASEALSYQCMRPYANSVCGLKLLVYEALRY
jgi:hypothetical protein